MQKIITSAVEWSEKCLSEPDWLATCLQRICRFGGQVPISVLTHSVVLSDSMQTPAQQLWALLHDAHEVLTGDCCRDYKSEDLAKKQEFIDGWLLKILSTKYCVNIRNVDLLAVRNADHRLGISEFLNPSQYSSIDTSVEEFVAKFDSLMATVSNG